jgi:hypothetical protein
MHIHEQNKTLKKFLSHWWVMPVILVTGSGGRDQEDFVQSQLWENQIVLKILSLKKKKKKSRGSRMLQAGRTSI